MNDNGGGGRITTIIDVKFSVVRAYNDGLNSYSNDGMVVVVVI